MFGFDLLMLAYSGTSAGVLSKNLFKIWNVVDFCRVIQ